MQNEDIQQVLDMNICLRALEEGLKDFIHGDGGDRPNIHIWAPCEREDAYYRLGDMEGVSGSTKTYAIRIKSDIVYWPNGKTEKPYCGQPGAYCGLILLFSTANAIPLAILQDGYLQHMRVGACAGLGVKYLAREDAKVLGIIGSGGMARTYLDAISKVRRLEEVRIYSPTSANREAFADEMARDTGLPVRPVDSLEHAVVGADIVATCTDSLRGEIVTNPGWIQPGMHLTNIELREWSTDIIERTDLLFRTGPFWDAWGFSGLRQFICNVVGQPHEVSRIPEWAHFFGRQEKQVEDLYKRRKPSLLVDLLAGKVPGRSQPDQVSFFTPVGLSGLQFSAVAGTVYQLATAKGIGKKLPDEWFVQTIRD